jgi:hypothetical protein
VVEALHTRKQLAHAPRLGPPPRALHRRRRGHLCQQEIVVVLGVVGGLHQQRLQKQLTIRMLHLYQL